MAKAKAVAEEKGAEKFMLLPVLVLILAQMGTSGDNGALSLAATALTQDLGATTAYNIDGGGSSTMYFDGDVVNDPLGKGQERGTSDILYIEG